MKIIGRIQRITLIQKMPLTLVLYGFDWMTGLPVAPLFRHYVSYN